MKRELKIVVLALAATAITACDKFMDVNVNPNAPVDVPVDQKLPNALVKTVHLETGALNQLGAVWTGYWAKATDSPGITSLFRLEETYGVEAMSFDRDGRPIWEDTYTTLVNYKDIETQATENGDLAYAGISKVMQGWHFMRLVDLYDNVPFSEALRGGRYATPQYEEGQTVYEGSINLITEGIRNIKEASDLSKKPAADDVMFKGNLTLWIKFANTVKLRALLRQSELGNTAYITSELAKIQQEGSGFLGAGESALVNPGYQVTAGLQNPFWDMFYKNPVGALTSGYNTLRPTEFVVQQYQNRLDPRLAKLYKPVGASYKGVPLGQVSGAAFTMSNTSALLGPAENGNQPAGLLKSAQQPSVLLSSSESLFLQAEAAERGWLTGAQDAYEAAIKESFAYLGVEAAEFTVYNALPAVNYTLAPNKIERIIEQKWLALNSISSIEAWNDYRRLGYPAGIPQSLQSPSPNPAFRPKRLTYRQSEVYTNREEVAKQGQIDPFQNGVFWDK
ncbi:SusD/RagB family nutrient-binding outer membrane lipoprotein [Pontibacter qinzhouensis]|uniref:SusD/RagB family nutrient-binding outer membrane lipoprotein n=1 Tax=Pontibacter qinzhouensis TaxID=2603253 RepID=A0A5C8K8T0_9BACT|nr:SusD/RagB family nutrient-binding outer membrane lipoprotein [Pontibacter qinzhouensis]TXK47153.1 SusD/RagB family nutrient-binding outer membrane lipoprotein [Pontibacter qinzhouensis]